MSFGESRFGRLFAPSLLCKPGKLRLESAVILAKGIYALWVESLQGVVPAEVAKMRFLADAGNGASFRGSLNQDCASALHKAAAATFGRIADDPGLRSAAKKLNLKAEE